MVRIIEELPLVYFFTIFAVAPAVFLVVLPKAVVEIGLGFVVDAIPVLLMVEPEPMVVTAVGPVVLVLAVQLVVFVEACVVVSM